MWQRRLRATLIIGITAAAFGATALLVGSASGAATFATVVGLVVALTSSAGLGIHSDAPPVRDAFAWLTVAVVMTAAGLVLSLSVTALLFFDALLDAVVGDWSLTASDAAAVAGWFAFWTVVPAAASFAYMRYRNRILHLRDSAGSA